MSESGIHSEIAEGDLEVLVKEKAYFQHKRLVICVIETHSGFMVTGESYVIRDEKFSLEVGRALAYSDALSKLRIHEAYLIRQRILAGG